MARDQLLPPCSSAQRLPIDDHHSLWILLAETEKQGVYRHHGVLPTGEVYFRTFAMRTVKYRAVNPELTPRRIVLEIPGWACTEAR